jgi:hypothetical protein
MAVCTPALQAKVDSSRHMEAFRTPSGTGGRAKHRSLVMAKAKGGGKLHPLPFTTFGEMLALGLEARVFCPSCYEHRPIDPHGRASPRPLFRDDTISLHQHPVHRRCLWLHRFRRDRADCAAPGRRQELPRLLVLRVVLAVVGDQPCADRPAAMAGGEAGYAATASSVQAATGRWPGASTGRPGGRPLPMARRQTTPTGARRCGRRGSC